MEKIVEIKTERQPNDRNPEEILETWKLNERLRAFKKNLRNKVEKYRVTEKVKKTIEYLKKKNPRNVIKFNQR